MAKQPSDTELLEISIDSLTKTTIRTPFRQENPKTILPQNLLHHK